jgi:hypothetical protein
MDTFMLDTSNANVQDAFPKVPIKNTELSAPGARENKFFTP